MMSLVIGLAVLCGFNQMVSAAVVDWAGTYRFEYVELDRTSLGDPKGRKLYALNRLSLSPKIVAVDGINIVSQFEVLSNSQYTFSQLGMPLGQGVNTSAGTGPESNLGRKNQSATDLSVRQLYLKINQEYGSIVVGRAPIHFGLGVSYNSGAGLFDHWGDVHDLVGYRFLIDSVSIMPMIGKPYQKSLAGGQSATDIMWNIEYNNPETKSVLGLFYQTRTANQDINDGLNIFNSNTNATYATSKIVGNWSTQLVSLFLSRGWDSFNFRMEGGFNGGNTGLATTPAGGTEQEVKTNGYGVAFEMDFLRPESKWAWTLKTGVASGDDPLTSNYEGFTFHRNYDVAFLMFNHPLGKYDLFTTNIQRNRAPCAANCSLYSNDIAADEETLSNVAYFSPQVDYKASDRWIWRNRLTWAQLQKNPWQVSGNEVAKDVGLEWDMAFIYQPHERVQWVNELGLLNPGAAWKGGSAGYDSQFTYGFTSKAAISF